MPSMKTNWVRSVKGTHFTTAIAAGDKEDENLLGFSPQSGPSFIIRRIIIIGKEQKAWEVMFWAKDTFNTGDADTEYYIGSKIFSEGDGVQIAGTGLYRYDSGVMALRYQDLDGSGEIHVSLANRSLSAKTVGVGGEVTVLLEIGNI